MALAVGAVGCSHPRADELQAISETFEMAASEVAWPGFEPTRVPLILYDDANTYMIRHPAPPPEFKKMRGTDDVWVADSVFAGLRANTDADFAGARSAVAGLVSDDPLEMAALLVHEAFHVYQTGTHPTWTANEVDLFTYPIRSARLLQLRRLEGGALRRAVTAPSA